MYCFINKVQVRLRNERHTKKTRKKKEKKSGKHFTCEKMSGAILADRSWMKAEWMVLMRKWIIFPGIISSEMQIRTEKKDHRKLTHEICRVIDGNERRLQYLSLFKMMPNIMYMANEHLRIVKSFFYEKREENKPKKKSSVWNKISALFFHSHLLIYFWGASGCKCFILWNV